MQLLLLHTSISETTSSARCSWPARPAAVTRALYTTASGWTLAT